jgi:DNA-binding beta-propeller fold protein YncE
VSTLGRSLFLALTAVMSSVSPAWAQTSSFGQLSGEDGCIVQRGIESLDPYADLPDGCARAGGLLLAGGVTLSPDQRFVYVAGGGNGRYGANGVATFRREAGSGALRPAGCISDDGGDGRYGSDGACVNGDALLGATDIAISQNGRRAYVASASSYGFAWFDRDRETGELTQRGCFKSFPRGDRCSAAPWLDGARAVAVTPDGGQVYVAASPGESSPGASDAISWFDRDGESGAVMYAGCVSATGSDGGCSDVAGLQGAADIAFSPDGTRLYAVASAAGALTSYARDEESGKLTQDGCLRDSAPSGGACQDAVGLTGAVALGLSPNGRDVYVAAYDDDEELGFLSSFRASDGGLRQTGCVVFDADDDVDEEESSGDGGEPDRLRDCASAPAAYGITDVAVAGDGGSLMVASDGGLYAFARDRDSGALTFTGCAESYEETACFEARGIGYETRIATSDNGRNAYVTTDEPGAIAVMGPAVGLARAGRLDRRSRAAALRLTCPRTHPGPCRGRLTLAARRARASAAPFRIRRGASSSARVSLTPSLRRRLRQHPGSQLTATASDASRRTRVVRARVVLRPR